MFTSVFIKTLHQVSHMSTSVPRSSQPAEGDMHVQSSSRVEARGRHAGPMFELKMFHSVEALLVKTPTTYGGDPRSGGWVSTAVE